MHSDTELKYQNYAFDQDPRWSAYLNNLYPTPTHSKLERFKRKWYKANIDKDLDLDINHSSYGGSKPNTASYGANIDANITNKANKPGKPSVSPSDNTNNACNHPNDNPSKPGVTSKTPHYPNEDAYKPNHKLFFHLESWMKILFIMTAFWFGHFANLIGFTVCVITWLRQCGFPVWTREYGRKILYNEYLQNILYMLPFLFYPESRNLFYFIPLGFHFWIGACEYVAIKRPELYKLAKGYIDNSRLHSNKLKLFKARLEILLMAYLILMNIISYKSIMMIILYANFIRVKYMINKYTKHAFSEFNMWIDTKLIHNHNVPGFLKGLIDRFRKAITYLGRI